MVFPAHAGMSRRDANRVRRILCFPRPRGDEPRGAYPVNAGP